MVREPWEYTGEELCLCCGVGFETGQHYKNCVYPGVSHEESCAHYRYNEDELCLKCRETEDLE